MNLRHLGLEELRKLRPAIRENWRTDSRNVFLALCLKDCMKRGQEPEITIAASCVLALDWLADYLEAYHSATASIEDCTEIALSLVRESVTVAGVLP